MPSTPRGFAGAKGAEMAARRDREVGENLDNELVAANSDHDDHDDEDDDDEEVTTRVYEVELAGGSSPWATAFLECASEGDLVTLTSLLDDGKVEIDDVDVDGFTALMIAAAEAQHDVAMELLRRGADVSIRTHEMRSTALHFAAKSGAAQVVAAICEQDPQRVDAQNLDGDTPLVWACTEGRVDAVRVLLQHGANVNVVSHRAMSALICAVMLRERDDSDGEQSDGEEIATTDADRAEIVRLLLTKNPKLVNYQDRDGSTAMHLAASHGYFHCVKALLEFGADITLRNAIGQTPLEEAEETGVMTTKSVECIAHLRTIWKRLEEEASARMMAMLEMEDTSVGSTTQVRSAKKTNKKKQRKSKQRRASKPNVGGATAGDKSTEDKAAASSGEGSSDEEADTSEKKPGEGSVAGVVAVETHASPARDAEIENDQKNEEAPHDGGVWTTVGRKHNQYLSQKAYASRTAEGQDEPMSAEPVSSSLAEKKTTPPTRHIVPASPRAKASDAMASSDSATPSEISSTPKIAPAKEEDTPGIVAQTESASTPVIESHPVNSPFSTFQRMHSTSRLYERYERFPQVAAEAIGYSRVAPGLGGIDSTGSSSAWRASAMTRNLHNPFSLDSGITSHSLPSTPTSHADPRMSTTSAIWRYAAPSASQTYDRGASFSSKKLASSERVETRVQHPPSASVLRYLSCGLCGERVNDNRQCNNSVPTSHAGASVDKAPMQCSQLYCAACLTRAAGPDPNAAAQCVKCGLRLILGDMKRNDFAEVQAATLEITPRATGSRHVEAHQHDLYEHMRLLMRRTSDRVQVTDVDPYFLMPNVSLASLSIGQLDALEEVHLAALQQITQARVENARFLERLRMEEWLKTQRDVFQFTSNSSTS